MKLCGIDSNWQTNSQYIHLEVLKKVVRVKGALELDSDLQALANAFKHIVSPCEPFLTLLKSVSVLLHELF